MLRGLGESKRFPVFGSSFISQGVPSFPPFPFLSMHRSEFVRRVGRVGWRRSDAVGTSTFCIIEIEEIVMQCRMMQYFFLNDQSFAIILAYIILCVLCRPPAIAAESHQLMIDRLLSAHCSQNERLASTPTPTPKLASKLPSRRCRTGGAAADGGRCLSFCGPDDDADASIAVTASAV